MEDIKKFIITMFNQCVLMKHEDYPESIFHVYDKSFIREKKIRRVINNYDNINYKLTKETKILFEQDYKNKVFYVRYSDIWLVLQNKYNMKYENIQKFIKNILLDINKMKPLSPINRINPFLEHWFDTNKMKSLSPICPDDIYFDNKLVSDKMKLLTPLDSLSRSAFSFCLLEPNKLNTITI